MPIKRYNTLSEWNSSTKSATESTVALVQEKNKVYYNGVNVWIKEPKVGCGLFIDNDGNKKWMPYETYNAADLPAGLTFVGTVYRRKDGEVGVLLNNPNTAKRWSEVVQWELGLTDGQGALSTGTKSFDVKLTRNLTTGDTLTGTFTTTAETTATFADEFNTWLHSLDNNWSCVIWTNGKARVQLDTYNQNNIACSITGISTSFVTGTEIKGTNYLSRNNGISSYYGGCNFGRFKYCYATLYLNTPTSNVADTSDFLYSSTAFENSPYMADMRALYGTFDNYLKARMVKFPSSRGVMAEEFRNGLTFTNTLAPITCTKYYGTTSATTVPLYPCANYCSQISFPSSGLTAGCWSSPSVYELMELHSIITYRLPGITNDNCDIVSKAQLKFGGAPLSTSSNLWTPCLYTGQNAWSFSGNGGYVSLSSFYYSFVACPVVLLTL